MKRSKTDLDIIKGFVDNTYCRYGQKLLVDTSKDFNPQDPESVLGFCFKYTDPITKTIVYKVECSKIGEDYTDFRILMHEYGHIYLGHLEDLYESLDSTVYNTIENYREELVEEINANCGIDFADKLLDRVIDDPFLNHNLHNIAMDMEVNSSILSLEDVDEIESNLTALLPNQTAELLARIADKVDNDEAKKELEDMIKKSQAANKVKLIHPFRYYLGPDQPFPDNLTYPQYLILIVRHLDQFVKMLVSIKMGGNGDTSQVTSQDIQDALNNILDQILGKSEAYKQGYRDAVDDVKNGNNSDQQQGSSSSSGSNYSNGSEQEQADYNQGYQDALRDMSNSMGNQGGGNGNGNGMQSLNDLMEQAGMSSSSQSSDSNSDSKGEGSGKGQDSEKDSSGNPQDRKMRENPNNKKFKDHSSNSRDKADQARSDGTIRNSGGLGCGNSGGSNGTRDVSKDVDEVDMALDEVMRNMKKRVINIATKKDDMRNYNRGIIRSVIAPTISRTVTICNKPKIVFLIDISGSMDVGLIDRCLGTIANSLRKISGGLKYDIITWNTCLGEHIKDIDPRRPITKVKYGGGTRIGDGIKYFKDNYGPEAILIIISDFEDSLEEWHAVEETMSNYSLYGFNYGRGSYGYSDKIEWRNLKVRKFSNK